jgi:hypothetical protein
MLSVFHRSLGGRVTLVELLPAEFACAVAAAPWERSTDQKSFAPWPADRARGAPVALPSTAADFAAPQRPDPRTLWEGDHNARKP